MTGESLLGQIAAALTAAGGIWMAWRKGQAEIEKLRVEYAAHQRAREEAVENDLRKSEEQFAARFDKRIERFMDQQSERIKALHTDMDSLERTLRETRTELERTRVEADQARTQVSELRRKLDDVTTRLQATEVERDRLEARVNELERQLAN